MHHHHFYVNNQGQDDGELSGCRLCALVCHLDREVAARG